MFDQSHYSTEDKLKNFPKYIQNKDLMRYLAMYELFKLQTDIKGSVVECGVHQGGGLAMWQHLSVILDIHQVYRNIVGFDTFAGFPNVGESDGAAKVGQFNEGPEALEELKAALKFVDEQVYGADFSRMELVIGDAVKLIPAYIKTKPYFLVSLLYLDFDLYEPTKVALDHFLPRMPKGAVLAFDEVNNQQWPGETQALLETFDLNQHQLRSFPWERNISYIVI